MITTCLDSEREFSMAPSTVFAIFGVAVEVMYGPVKPNELLNGEMYIPLTCLSKCFPDFGCGVSGLPNLVVGSTKSVLNIKVLHK